MAGSFGSPYRSPCGGWPSQPHTTVGGCYQHRKANEDNINTHINSTTVPDWRDPSDPAYNPGGIPPYSREDLGLDWPGGGGDCPGNLAGCVPTAGATPCGPWPLSEIVEQTYASNGNNNYSECRHLGFKNVQALKFWHGRFGFLSHETASPAYDSVLTGSSCSRICGVESDQTGLVNTTKYRTIAITGHIDAKYAVAATADDFSMDLSETMTVGQNTGVMTQSGCSVPSPGKIFTIYNVDLSSGPSTSWPAHFYNYLTDRVSAVVAYSGIAGSLELDEVPTCSGTTWEVVFGSIAGAAAGNIKQQSGYSGNSFYRRWWGIKGASGSEVSYKQAEFLLTFTDTTLVFTMQQWAVDGSGNVFLAADVSVNITLSNAFTSADVYNEVKSLLGYWDITNNVVYPWRKDGHTVIAPVVSHNEVPTAVVPTFNGACSYVDPNAEEYDGSIRGAPLGAGYGPYFDWRFVEWKFCSDASGIDHFYKFKHGGYSFDWPVPLGSTRWTQQYSTDHTPAGYLPGGGAWIIHSAGACYAQKWAEIKIPRPSHNFARPCAIDRLLIDQDTVRCISDVTTSGGIQTITILSATPINTGDICYACGTATAGFYIVTKNSSTQYELTTPVTISSPLDYDCGSGIFGKVRFPAAPGFGGRIAVSAASNTSPIQITLSESVPYLRTGDHVDISGVLGNTASNVSNSQITIIDSTHFTLDAVNGNGDYSGGGYVKCTGAADYQWFDDQPKGQFVHAEWGFNYRDVGERNRLIAAMTGCMYGEISMPDPGGPIRSNQALHGMPSEVSSFSVDQCCLPFTPCEPQVMCITPNGEAFANGITKGFPESFICDDRYGSRWQSSFVQHQDDLLFQSPHVGCVDCNPVQESVCVPTESGGQCPENECLDGCFGGSGQRAWYAQRPLCEAILELPAGAPALSYGHLGYLSLADLDTSGSVSGNVLPPPAQVGYSGVNPNQAVTPWGIYIAQMQCVCNGGIYAADYASNGVSINCP